MIEDKQKLTLEESLEGALYAQHDADAALLGQELFVNAEKARALKGAVREEDSHYFSKHGLRFVGTGALAYSEGIQVEEGIVEKESSDLYHFRDTTVAVTYNGRDCATVLFYGPPRFVPARMKAFHQLVEDNTQRQRRQE